MRRSTPFLISGAVLLLAVACTHDFDAFESGSSEVGADGSAGSDASSSDASSGDSGSGSDGGGRDAAAGDAGCIPPTSCFDAAASCGAGCVQNEGTCESKCPGGGGGRPPCLAACQDAGANCTVGCVGTCVICAGCSSEMACETAVE
ncbi:MAG: hypothetical protein ACRELY_05170 [Polyangiaceae bacterium]